MRRVKRYEKYFRRKYLFYCTIWHKCYQIATQLSESIVHKYFCVLKKLAGTADVQGSELRRTLERISSVAAVEICWNLVVGYGLYNRSAHWSESSGLQNRYAHWSQNVNQQNTIMFASFFRNRNSRKSADFNYWRIFEHLQCAETKFWPLPGNHTSKLGSGLSR